MAFLHPDQLHSCQWYQQQDTLNFKPNWFPIPEADKWRMTSPQVDMLVQELTVGDFVLIILSGATTSAIEFNYTLPSGGVLIIYLLEEETDCISPKTNEYTICYSNSGWTFPEGSHQFLQLYINTALLLHLSLSFTSITALIYQPFPPEAASTLLGTYTVNAETNECVRRIITCSFSGQMAQKYLQLKIEELLFNLNMQLTVINNNLTSPRAGITLLHEVLTFIEQHLDQPIQLQTIMKAFHFSEYKTKKLFQEINTSFTDYLTTARMKKAMQLLKNSSLKIAAVAKEAGYISASKFSQVFYKYYGVLPRDVRSGANDQDNYMPK